MTISDCSTDPWWGGIGLGRCQPETRFGVEAFRPSSYQTDLTMDGTGQPVALATGASKVRISNKGATTQAIRLAFGIDAADAVNNLNIVAGAATTGVFIGSPADGYPGSEMIGAPADATYFAVANAVIAGTPVISLEQGV